MESFTENAKANYIRLMRNELKPRFQVPSRTLVFLKCSIPDIFIHQISKSSDILQEVTKENIFQQTVALNSLI